MFSMCILGPGKCSTLHARSVGQAELLPVQQGARVHTSANAEGQQAIYGHNGSAPGPKIQILLKGTIPIPKQCVCACV